MKINSLWTVTFFKGIAILMVILVHTAQMFVFPSWVSMGFRFLQMGCQIFMVLSSFALCMSMEHRKDTFGGYVKRRIKSILPGYWGMILIYLLLALGSFLVVKENVFRTDTSPLDILLNFLLLHGLVPNSANNLVVRGGWFVGTIMLLYLMTPFLFTLYKRLSAKTRWVSFPIIVFLVGFLSVLGLGKIHPVFECSNNSFMYFSFLNQMGCYSLGFSLWDLYSNKRIKKYRCPFIVFLVLAGLSVCVFYAESWEYAFSVEPMLFGIAFSHFFIWVQARFGEYKIYGNPIIKVIMIYGKYSFFIYLTHMLLAWEGSKVLKMGIYIWGIDISDVYIFAIWVPFLCLLALGVGIAYAKLVDIITKITTSSDTAQE